MPGFAARHSGLLLPILLGVGLLVSFGGSLTSSTFVAHDASILRLPLVSWWRNVPTIFSPEFLLFSQGQFRPLSYALLALARTFVDAENLLFWHLWLLAFHGLNAVLVFRLVRHFAQRRWSAACAAAVFAFHPVGSVLANNPNHFHYLLGLVFYLGAFLAYLSHVSKARTSYQVGALVCFVLGVLTSKIVFAIPLVLAAYEMLYRRTRPAAVLARLAPFAAVSLLLSPLYWSYTPHPLHFKYVDFPEGAGWYTLFSVVGGTGSYAWGLLLAWDIPVVLHDVVERIFQVSHWKFILWSAVNLLVLFAGGWTLWRERLRWLPRWAGLGVLLMCAAWLPFASMWWHRVEEFVAWEYLYVPLVGLAFLIGGVADAVGSCGPRVRVGATVLLCLLVLYYGGQQARLNLASRSATAYWTRVVGLAGHSEPATLALGKAHLERGDTEKALASLFGPARKQLHGPSLAMREYYTHQGDLVAAAVHRVMSANCAETGLQSQICEMAAADLFRAAGAPDYAEEALGKAATSNPYNLEAMGRQAEIWAGKGYVTAAGRLLERATEVAPHHPTVARMRANLETQRRTLAASDAPQILHPPDPGWLRYVVRSVYEPEFREELLRAGERHPGDPVLQLEAAMNLLERGDHEQALAKITGVVRSLPSSSYAWATKAWIASKVGAHREAVAAGLRAQELDPQSPIAHGVLAVLFSKQVRSRGGGPATPQDLDQAIRHLEYALELNPRNAVTHANMGNLLSGQGKTERAVEHYRKAAKLNPALASAHARLGDLMAQQGKAQEAVEHYRQALRSKPEYVEVHTNMGNLLVGLGKLEEGIGHYRQALRLQPDHIEAINNLGVVLERQGKADEAIDHFRQALRRQPSSANVHFALGNLLRGQGDLGEAIAHLRRAVELQPQRAEAHNNLAIALGQQGKLEEAVARLRQVIRLQPTFAQAYANLSKALTEQERFGESIQTLQEGLTRVPNHVGLSIQLAEALSTCPDSDLRSAAEAVGLAERVCRMTEFRNPQALNALAAAYAEAGRFEDAVQQAEVAMGLAGSAGQVALQQQIASRLELYRGHQAAR